MHGNRAENQQLLQSINTGLRSVNNTQVLVFPPFIYIDQVAGIIAEMDSAIGFGSQNMSEQAKGAFTGEISASMLTDLSCTHVLVGHSERRSLYHETDEQVADKFVAASTAGITPILCIGESLEEREAGNTLEVVFRQIDALINKAGAAELMKVITA